MNVRMVKIVDAFESPTNPRTFREDQAFKDLVASIKEKGVLVPVIVRPTAKSNKFEVVAGNRRLKAATAAGLAEIPADVRELSDEEAREVQIIENLQRADVHPLDEGEAYRQLREKGGQEIKSIAVKVGKSEDYVRNRMSLTMLADEVRRAYRLGKIQDGHALLIARLGTTDQLDALKYCTGRYDLPTVKSLKEEIETRFYKPLSQQPWIGDPELEKAVGKCQECPPNKSDLFGTVKEGACTDLKCWKRKMAAYIDHRVNKEKLLKISHEYSYGSDKKKGVFYDRDFTSLSTKVKEHCKSARQALVVEGSKLGRVEWVCADQSCKQHGRGNDPYALTPAQKKKQQEERKKELAAQKAKLARHEKETAEVLGKVGTKNGEKMINIFFELAMVHTSTNDYRPIVQRRKLEIPRTKTQYQPKGYLDYEKAIRNAREKMEIDEVLKLAVELLLPSYESYKRGAITKLF